MPLCGPHARVRLEETAEIRHGPLTGHTSHVAGGFTVHCRLSNVPEASDINYFEVSHDEALAFLCPEEAAKSLRGRFEDPERGRRPR